MTALEHFFQDLRHTLRQLRKNPGFALAAILVLGLGLGANAAIFSVVNSVLLHGLPYADPARLVVLYERDLEGVSGQANISYPDYRDWRDQSRTLENLAIARNMSFNLSGGNSPEPQRVDGLLCSWTLLPALGNRPMLGRIFTAADDQPGASRVAIISYSLWQKRLGGAAGIVGRGIRLNARDYEIIGVMPKSFAYPAPGTQIWVPVTPSIREEARVRRGWRQFHGLARLRPGIGLEQARLELNGIALRIKKTYPDMALAAGADVLPLEEYAVRNVRTALVVLFGAVGCVLLIACVNIANLLLARVSRRRREMAIRSAMGAPRGRVIRQLLTESSCLSLAGAGFGLLLASFLIDALQAAMPALLNRGSIQPTGDIRLDVPVFLFITLVALVVGLAVGLVPALQLARGDLTVSLKEGGRSVTSGRSHATYRNLLIAAEVALSLVLLVAAGLLLRSFAGIRSVRPGVRTDHLLTAGISLPSSRYRTDAQIAGFTDELRRKLTALSGVRAAEMTNCLPIDGSCGDQFFSIDGHPLPPGHTFDADTWAVSPGFFRTMGIPILRGRGFTAQDEQLARTKSQRYTVVISRSMARQFWPGEDPIGQTIYFGDAPDDPRWEVVGVCGDVLYRLDEKPDPAYFVPLTGWTTFYAVLDTVGRPETLAKAVAQVIASLDPDVPAFQIRTMQEVADSSTSNRRFSAVLIGLFAGTALLLAALGLYGVLSNLVSQRTGELGIRVVFGATRSQVQTLVLRQAMRPVAGGLVVGLVAALAAGRLLRSLLFGVTGTDLPTFATASLLLLAVAVLACMVPAWRAGRIDPAVALRNE